MPSNRIGRINEEIQRELAALIPTVKDPRVSGMISVTAVETTPDLKFAKIYISALDKGGEEQVLRGLKSASGYLRRELGRSLNLRYTPELTFVRDDSINKGAHILEMLRDPEVVKPANPRQRAYPSGGRTSRGAQHSLPRRPAAGQAPALRRCTPVVRHCEEGRRPDAANPYSSEKRRIPTAPSWPRNDGGGRTPGPPCERGVSPPQGGDGGDPVDNKLLA